MMIMEMKIYFEITEKVQISEYFPLCFFENNTIVIIIIRRMYNHLHNIKSNAVDTIKKYLHADIFFLDYII